jgi:peptidoglycan/LPS O-acetylase OafA/YrhL
MSKRLPGVDGLRAVAALWVVLYHMMAFSRGPEFPEVPGLDLFLRSGSTGVSLFLVLSGFCLFLPFAGGRTARFKIGEFLLRRCRRLMPAYYVALVLALVLAIVSAEPLGLPRLSPSDILWQLATHLTLTHTLFPSTFYTLNGAFWSLGLEWQLYLALPLLVWITSRFGLARAVALAVVCNVAYRLALGVSINSGLVQQDSLLSTSVFPNQLPGRWAEFAFGMVAAELYATGRLQQWARFVPGMQVAVVILIPIGLVASGFALAHIAYGALFFTLLCVVISSDNLVARLLAWRPLVALGTMSYSLYLVHQPLLQLFGTLLARGRPDLTAREDFALLLAGLPVIVLVAWLLFVSVERRTLSGRAATPLNRVRSIQADQQSLTPAPVTAD